MLRILAITTLALAAASSAAYADVYRWVDEHGGVHYSDRWVPGSELIKFSRPHPPTPDTTAARMATERSQLATISERITAQQGQQATAQAVKQDVAKIREQQCKDAKERYQKAIESRRIYKAGKDGEREYFSDQEADTYRLQARNDMQLVCGSSAGK
jgi:hypothetical protein